MLFRAGYSWDCMMVLSPSRVRERGCQPSFPLGFAVLELISCASDGDDLSSIENLIVKKARHSQIDCRTPSFARMISLDFKG